MTFEPETQDSPRLPAATVRHLQQAKKREENALPATMPETLEGESEPKRNMVFSKLVANDKDITGLVAYGLYKLAKRDWAEAFRAENHRDPTDEEANVFILGEQTPRRLENYRQLAVATLRAQGGKASGGMTQASEMTSSSPSPAPSYVTAPADNAQPKPKMRELTIRLALLTAAVVIVALLIRFFVLG
jgi:hypothetical protein